MLRYLWMLAVATLVSPLQAAVLLPLEGVTVTAPSDVAVSQDGATLYAVSFQGNSIEVMSRNPLTGSLVPVETKSGDPGLIYPLRIVVSADGQFVYVISQRSFAAAQDALLVYSRDGNGKLTFVEVVRNGGGGVTDMSLPSDMALSADGEQLYVRADGSSSLSIFNRNITTGKLTWLQTLRDSDAEVNGLKGKGWLAVAADGYVYTTSSIDNSLSVFARDPATHRHAWVNTYLNPANGLNGIGGVWGLAVSPDDKHLYVVGGGDDAVALFARDGNTGELIFKAAYKQGDMNQSGDTSLRFDGLQGPLSVQVGPDGQHVYINGSVDNGGLESTLAVMRRDPFDGTLSFQEVQRSTSASPIAGLDGNLKFALAPDGGFLYSAGINDNNVGVFKQTSVDLSLVVLDEADPINLGDSFNYTLTVTNNSALTARGVAVTSVLPAEVGFVGVDSANCVHNAGIVKCELGDLAGGAHRKINIQVAAPATTALLHNEAVVFSAYNDINPDDNRDQQNTTIADLTPNAPPVAMDDAVSILPGEDALLDIVANDQDDDGDTLTIVDKSVIKQTDASDGGKLLIYDETHVFYVSREAVDGTRFSGMEEFMYRVSDGKGGVAEGKVTIVVNTPPVAANDTAKSIPGKTITLDLLANDQDADGDTLTIVSVEKQSEETQGTLDISGTYTPPAKQNGKEYTGTERFIYRVRDENGGESNGQVAITVNAAPTAGDDSATIKQGESAMLYVLTNDGDPDGDGIAIASIDTSMLIGGSVMLNGSEIVYTTFPTFVGKETFTYTIQDSVGDIAQANVTINVQLAANGAGDDPPPVEGDNGNGGGGSNDASMLLLLFVFCIADRLHRSNIRHPLMQT